MKQRSPLFTLRVLSQALCSAAIISTPAFAATELVTLPAVSVKASAEQAGSKEQTQGWFSRSSQGASKTDTPLRELPQSVSVVNRQQIEQQTPQTIGEALNYSAGAFSGLVGGGNRYDYVALRGFVDNSVENTVLDGLRLMSDSGSFSAMQIDPYFVERIDLIRGPASVLYGRSSPGGLVALTSKRPQASEQHEVRVDLGTDARQALAFDSTNVLNESGTLSYRLTGLAQRADSMQDHVEEQRLTLMPQLLWQPNENTSLLLQAYLQKDPKGGYHSGVPYEGSVTERAGQKIKRSFYDGEADLDVFERTQRMLSYQLEHRFSPDWKVRQNLRYVSSDVKTGSVYQKGWKGDRTLERGFSGAKESLSGLAVDTQVEGALTTGSMQHALLAGFDYQTRSNEGYWSWASVSDIDAFTPAYGKTALTDPGQTDWQRDLDQTGVYLQDQISVDRWRFTLGARYDHAKVTTKDLSANTQANWEGGQWTKRLGALYLFDNGLAPYASFSESFDPNTNTQQDGSLLEPLRGKQYEVGLKYQPANSRTLLTAAIYDLEQRNLASTVPNTNYSIPVGTVRSRGLELEANTPLNDQLTMLASYTLSRMETQGKDAETQGKTPVQVPEHKASLWLNYTPVNGAELGLGSRYIGSTWADTSNTLKVPAVTLIDFSLNLQLGNLIDSRFKGASVQLSANNVLDKDYIASCYSSNYCYFGRGRTVLSSLRYQW
ncbi:MAG: TonB-dependent siderophore receptor [Proteobacteria bacterium]|nr:TonB-dependent siderophore receptor [Pseudomonadota bacterium]